MGAPDLTSLAPADLYALAQLGAQFKRQQAGRRPGALSRLVLDAARRAGHPYTFAKLLAELEIAAARRDLHGERASAVEKVDRVWQLVTVHLPRRGRTQVPFGTIRNHLTTAKKILHPEFPLCSKP